ncbi:hypothetical protein PBI_SMEAGOL_4 [Mycobacterium phage Smeagol]|nr:hypothetical protein PBI_SMEAGOL_4 [Mycobacterium phage Smeagol]
MPREFIGQSPNEDGFIEARWGRDEESVQLTVKGPPYWRDKLAGVDIKIEPHTYAHPEFVLDWHLSLGTRKEINDLIRLLKRARDQAFGRDE